MKPLFCLFLGWRVSAMTAVGLPFTYLGIVERRTHTARGSTYATLVAIDPERGIVSAHRKVQPTYEERLAWGAGDGNGLRVHIFGPDQDVTTAWPLSLSYQRRRSGRGAWVMHPHSPQYSGSPVLRRTASGFSIKTCLPASIASTAMAR